MIDKIILASQLSQQATGTSKCGSYANCRCYPIKVTEHLGLDTLGSRSAKHLTNSEKGCNMKCVLHRFFCFFQATFAIGRLIYLRGRKTLMHIFGIRHGSDVQIMTFMSMLDYFHHILSTLTLIILR